MRAVRIAGIALGALYAAYVAFVMLSASRGSSRTSIAVPLLLFFCWAVSPIVLVTGVVYRSEGRTSRAIELIRFVAVCALVVFGAAAYQVAFFGSHPDAQSGLLFAFVPLYQWFAVAVVLVLLAVVARYHRRRGP